MSTNPQDQTISELINVYIRQRPHDTVDVDDSADISNCIKNFTHDGRCIYSQEGKREHEFKYNGFLDQSTTQENVFNTVAKDIVDSAINGYSGTIFAYGPTNSGKTFTMRGNGISGNGDDMNGILPRTIEHLLENIGDTEELWVSYLQIYCEVLSDLISPQIENNNESAIIAPIQLAIREKTGGGTYVEGLSRIRVHKYEDFNRILELGDSNRNTSETLANATSSRSHATLIITIVKPEKEHNKSRKNKQMCRESSLFLVDLAGSERASATTGLNYMRSEEAKSINLSLSALGNCMNAMAENKPHIPYRDSKLTRLLQGSLGGNARTAVIVNIPHGDDETGETVNALRFASRASRIKVEACISRYVNYEVMYKDAMAQLDNYNQEDNDMLTKLTGRDQIIKQQTEDIDMFKEQLSSLRSEVQCLRLININSNNDTDNNNDNNGNLSAIETLKSELTNQSEKHFKDLGKLRTQHEQKIRILERNNQTCNEEINTLQGEVKEERERHLKTVQEMSKYHGKISSSELHFEGRIQELLTDCSEKDAIIEELQDALGTSSELLQTMSNNINNLNEQLEEKVEIMKTMVTKEEVVEIENKFIDTFTKLTNRVQDLEIKPSNNNDSNQNHGMNLGIIMGGRNNNSNVTRNTGPTGAVRQSNSQPALNTNRQQQSSLQQQSNRMGPGGRVRSNNSNARMF
jgi:hypothetical protein